MKNVKVSVFLIAVLLIGSLVQASTPPLINYQGRILDSNGSPVPDGNYPISFAIYNAPDGGLQKWQETQPDVAVIDGYFGAMLGSVVSLTDSVFNEAERYLEIIIDGQAISPRTRFTSSGYSYRTSTIDGATAGELSGTLKLVPSTVDSVNNAIIVVDGNDSPVFEVSIDQGGFSNVSFYEPTDSKNAAIASLSKSLNIGISPQGSASISFYEPADSKKDMNAIPGKAMEISVDDFGVGSISFYEPADSKFGAQATARKVEMNKSGLVMFGATDLDTSLFVAPNGDIIGLGQITMGQNSSDGVHTSVLGFDNNAAGDSSSIGGGSFNEAYGAISVIGGGFSNTAFSTGATIGGGSSNNVSGDYATIGGGSENSAMGFYSVIPGGQGNVADGDYSFAGGHRAKAMHNGAFVWADQTDEDFVSGADDQFLIRAKGGVGIGTNSPTGLLEVAGQTGDTSVNFPVDAISSGEIFDEPGLSSERGMNDLVLPQNAASLEDVVITTITIPSSGYIMVSGGATFESVGTNKANQVFVQIDETAGGGIISPFYTVSGAGDHDTPNTSHFFSLSTQRIYYKEAGTYEFRLEAQANPDNGSGAVSIIRNPYLTAVYFPTSYGTVSMSSGSQN